MHYVPRAWDLIAHGSMDLQVLKETELFKDLSPVHLAHIASILQEREVDHGEIIFAEQEEAKEFFVIKKGRVRISKVIPGMGEEALAILNQGAYFGEMELIEPSPRAAQATAHENCILQTFAYDDFHTLLSTDNELALAILWNFLRTLSRRLADTDNKVAATFAMAQFR